MIINYPTGLFDAVLPKTASDPTSVIFTISGDLPESRVENFPVLPDGIRKVAKPSKIYDSTERRAAAGLLVYVDSTHIESDVKSGQPLYKLGQILDFTTTTSPQNSIVPNFPGKSTITRHDIARLDTTLIGMPDLFDVPDGEGETVRSVAIETYNNTISQIEELQAQYDALETSIDMHYKVINESNRAIAGLNAIIAFSPSPNIVAARDELVATNAANQTELNDHISNINLIPSQIQALKDTLNSLIIFVE